MEIRDYLNPDNLPEMIGPYKVEAPLARGGMSLVFLGYDTRSTVKETVVVKVLLPEYTKDKRMNEHFMNEARILTQLFHPNIPKIYEVGEWEHGLYIGMEYFKGISLRSFIHKHSFSLKKALEIILNIGYALYHLHSHGIVHRDLKPENVIVTENGEIKVIDFSLSQLIPEDKLEHMLEERLSAGTPMYMTPEQRDNPKLVTKATDIYALGIIGFELILGKSTYGVIQTFLLPRGLRQIIEKAIQILPELRYQDIADFIKEISDYLKELESGTVDREVSESGAVKELLDHIHSIVLPCKTPKWPQIKVEIAVQEGMAINALYLDFFQLKDSKYALFLAAPLRTGLSSLFHTFSLRGMVRLEALGKGEMSKEALQRISNALYNDPMDQKFGSSKLILKPRENKAVFTSCKFSGLWHVRDKVTIYQTEGNGPLGHYSKGEFQEVEIDWQKGDLLVLYSNPMDLKHMNNYNSMIQSFKDDSVEKLMQKFSEMSPTSTHNGSCLVILRRFEPSQYIIKKPR